MVYLKHLKVKDVLKPSLKMHFTRRTFVTPFACSEQQMLKEAYPDVVKNRS